MGIICKFAPNLRESNQINKNPMRSFQYPVLSATVIDGDTIAVVLDQGFSCTMSQYCRLYGIDTPESSTRAGKLVTELLKEKLSSLPPKSLICKSIALDKYAGRFVGQIWADDFCLNDWLLDIGVGKPYLGKKKDAWEEVELEKICEICESLLAKQKTNATLVESE